MQELKGLSFLQSNLFLFFSAVVLFDRQHIIFGSLPQKNETFLPLGCAYYFQAHPLQYSL